MREKILMVLGMGLGKFTPMLFGLYLSREFGAATFASFVLVLTYVSALAALPSLGATPQIIRAGAYDDPDNSVVRITFTSLMLLVLVVTLSVVWWQLFAEQPLLSAEISPLLIQCWITTLTAGFVLYALAQSVCSQRGHHFEVGVYSMAIYIVAAAAGVVAGLRYGAAAALTVYCLMFLAVALLFFLVSQRRLLRAWRKTAGGLLDVDIMIALRDTVKTSLFGLITLFGLYLLMKTAQQRLPIAEGATFALGFQLFQIGIFLPSVLGAVVVPRLVETLRDKSEAAAAELRQRTQIVYMGIGIIWLLVVLGVASTLLSIYGLPGAGWSGLVLLQAAAVLAALQAYYIQSFVAHGRFGQLAIASTLWSFTGYATLLLVTPSFMGVVMALLLAYVVSLTYFKVNSLRSIM